jgi:hypothetical protein
MAVVGSKPVPKNLLQVNTVENEPAAKEEIQLKSGIRDNRARGC